MPNSAENWTPTETREAMCVAFCVGLPDEVLSVALGNHFTVKLLWAQRDAAYLKLAESGVGIP